MSRADAIVVGAGFGGLGTALSLAERGAKVRLFERLTYPGGCACTFDHDGDRFEGGATLFSGFDDEQIQGDVGALSGGWKMRVGMAKVLLGNFDVLLLDEPTNHLDLSALLWFQEYLKTQSCAVLLISHDRQFMDSIVQKVFEFSNLYSPISIGKGGVVIRGG